MKNVVFVLLSVLSLSTLCNAGEETQKKELTSEEKRKTNSGVFEFTQKNLKHEIENSKGWLAVHFSSYDKNCGYCVQSNDPVAKLVSEYSSKVQFARLASQPYYDLSPETLENYSIAGVPILIVFKDGKEEFRVNGWGEESGRLARAKFDECCKN